MIRDFHGACTQSLESKAPGHASTHDGNFDWIQLGRGPRTSDSHSRYIHQLSRVMAHQYRNAVGPWSAYLGVLQCAGHSA